MIRATGSQLRVRPSPQSDASSGGGPLERRLLEHLRSLGPAEGGLVPGEGLVVGLSGGSDSLALLDLLHRFAPERELRLVAAHLDHGLRPDSAADRAACEAACAQRGIELVSMRAHVERRALRAGAGVEAAGRLARHALFEYVRRRRGLDRIATGHHLDDHIETLALWTLRGSGLRGLTGIAPARGNFVRPLRARRREELRAYLRERGLPWCEDPSNADPTRQRNALRHAILPLLDRAMREGFGDLDWRSRIDALSRRAHQERSALEELIAQDLENLTCERGPGRLVVDRTAFASRSEAVQFQLLRAAASTVQKPGAHQRWNEARYSDVLSFVARARPGLRWPLPGGGWIEIERDRVILIGDSNEWGARRRAEPSDGRAQPQLCSELLPASARECSFWKPEEAWFDAARVRLPFTLRPVRPGDRLQPFGMEGHKKVSTLMAERSVPRDRRAHQWVVSDADRILWVVGITICDRARVDDQTQAVWRLWIDPPAVPTGGRTP